MERFDLVAFDCDSTLGSNEGADELALRAGLGEQIAVLAAELGVAESHVHADSFCDEPSLLPCLDLIAGLEAR